VSVIVCKENGKTCTKCNIWKECYEFHKNKCSLDGFRSVCRQCRALQRAEPSANAYILQYNAEYRSRPDIRMKRIEYNMEYNTRPEVKATKQKYSEEYELKKKLANIEERLSKGAKPGDIVLYFIKFVHNETKDTFYKIGITELSVKERYRKYNNYSYEVLSEYYFEREYCSALEQKLIYEHILLGLQCNHLTYEQFIGYTECFVELKEEILSKYLP